jgi:hypothetical protein
VNLGLVTTDFEVLGDKAFAVLSFIPGAGILDPSGVAPNQLGDPSLRAVVPVEQFRTAYAVAPAPSYDATHIEVLLPAGATLTIDGNPSLAPSPLGSTGYGILRIPADSTSAVMRDLEADKPFGVQVVGYGNYTSYAHAAGMNLGPLQP